MVTPSDASALGEGRRDSRVGVVLADRYRVDALIDSGAMGRVYLGEHVLMRKRVAIKVLHRELTLVPEFVARFEREAMAAANIQSEHVVAATDFGKLTDGAVFLVLEYLEGRNLRDEMAPGPIPLMRALHIARQIAVALRSAHALSIVHRDLKPDNVMLVDKAGDPDFAKVLDFGIAKVPIGEVASEPTSQKPITKAGMVFGTPEYMPPEQALGQSVDERADLYSLGVILFEMLAGVRPFAGTSNVGILGQQLSRDPPTISERAPGVHVPPPIQRFVSRLLAREVTERVQTAQEVVAEIDQYLGLSPARDRIPTLGVGTLSSTMDTDRELAGLPWGHTRGRALGQHFSGSLGRLGAWIDDHKGALPGPLRRLPAPVLLSIPLSALGVAFGIGVVTAFSPATPQAEVEVPRAEPSTTARVDSVPSPEPRGLAPAEDFARASKEGVPALTDLESRFPTDARLPLARSGHLLRSKDVEGAVRAMDRALELDPQLADDAQIASALWIAAQNKQGSKAAFALLGGRMGTRGRAILKDLATTPGVKQPIRDEAARILSRP